MKRRIIKNKYIFNDDFNIPNDLIDEDEEFKEFRSKKIKEYPYNIPNNFVPFRRKNVPYLHDYNIKSLKREFQRPYFSPKRNSYEIDLMFCNLNDFHRIYAVLININTKFLIIKPLHSRNESEVLNFLRNVINKNHIVIDNIRGDAEKAFLGRNVKDFLRKNNISFYFTNGQHTNRNRIVDRVMRTIRDMFDFVEGINGNKAILNTKYMNEMVDAYNNSFHSAFKNKFTPTEVQNNSEVENIFIREHMLKLREIKEKQRKKGLFNYTWGNVLLIHIPRYENVFNKRRRYFNQLAQFEKYQYGNVVCNLYVNGKISNETITIPIYFTKFVCNDIFELLESDRLKIYRDYFNFYDEDYEEIVKNKRKRKKRKGKKK
jgi:hypothetical protein